MASEYASQSPTAASITTHPVAMQSAYPGPTAGHDFAYDPALSIDTAMGTAPYIPSGAGAYPDMSNDVLPGVFDPSLLTSPGMGSGASQYPPSESTSSLIDAQSPAFRYSHRPSGAANSQRPNFARQNSFGASETNILNGSAAGEEYADGRRHDANVPPGNDELAHSPTAAPPSWSELKTKAGKERKRLPLACIACRRKKIRCSGEKPACKHCLRSRIPCVYKVTTRKAAPRTDYMAMLDKRLKRMEDRVIKTIPKEDQGIVNSTGRAMVKPPLPPPPKPAASVKKRGAEQAFGDELDEWASGPATAASTKSTANAQTDTDAVAPEKSEEHSLLLEGSDKLPPKHLQEHLAEVYFDFVYGQSYHLLHKPSFMRKLAQGAVPPVLVLAVCAISARFSSHPDVRTEPAFLRGEDWASAARDIALKRYDTPNITILIVYLILGLHEFGTCQGGRSWMFGGMAQRMAYALQLHRDLDHDPKERAPDAQNVITFTDREIRRRTMWSCFIMDRFNSSGTDRPIFVSEQYIRAQLPVKEHYYQIEVTGPTEDLDGNVPNPIEPGMGELADAKANMGAAAFLIRLVSIYGKIITYHNQGGKELDAHPMWSEQSRFRDIRRKMTQWKASLPSSLEYNAENFQDHVSSRDANQFLFMHIVYHQILLFMYRFALPMPGTRPNFPTGMPDEFIAQASRTALESASAISALVNEAMDHRVLAPFAGYAAFASSTVHIYGVFSKDPELQAASKQNLAWNVKYLTKMKKYWGMFHYVTENLRDLYRRIADAARSGDRDSKETDQPIFQYGDWFDRYPHGVNGTDYEEPSVEVKEEPGSDGVLGQQSDLQTVEEFFSKLSPPSKAAQLQQQQSQQPQSRKTAKKRRPSKLDSNNRPNMPAHGQAMQSQDALQALGEQPQMPSQQIRHDLASTQAFQTRPNLDGMLQHTAGFPPGFANSLPMMHPQQLMSQLDRRMVLNSYADLNPHAGPQHPQANLSTLLDPAGMDGFDPYDFSNPSHAGAHANGGGNGGFWGDPSNAWFMPFNMDPPTTGEDSSGHIFGREFDSFGAFDGMGVGMGMPPRLPVDADHTGQDGSGVAELDEMNVT